MPAATRVAFTLIGGKNWTGGQNYLINLLRIVAEQTPGQLTPVLFVGSDAAEADLAPFLALPGCELVRSPGLDERHHSASLLRCLLLGRNAHFSALLAAHRIDVVFESAVFFGWRLGLPAIAWMPDLQHRLMPHHFTRFAWWKREIGFQAQIRSGRTVMVSSEDSRAACLRFYPAAVGRVQAVRFAVPAPASIDDATARAVADRYGLPARYFFMPNQYWQHKNHLLVIEALGLLRQRGQTVTVVAPGKQLDPRNAAHVPTVLAAVRAAGLESQFLMPGMIPYADLMPLMQASSALLNPSLLEGWSTTVEEARSAGVPMLLSDLAVHREQAGAQACYFERESAASLADALQSFAPTSMSERQELRQAAQHDAQFRVARFATDFVALVSKARSRAMYT